MPSTPGTEPGITNLLLIILTMQQGGNPYQHPSFKDLALNG